jgi:hypothetical protein
MKINAQSKRLGNYHASVGSLEVKVKYFRQHTYFCIICRSRTETSLLFLLMSDSKLCICSAVNFILWGFSNSQTKGRPRPRVLTSTSSRPEAENLIPTQINEWPQVSCQQCTTGLTVGLCRAMAQVISCRPLTAEARVRAWVNPCGICGGQSGIGIGFSPSSSGFPVNISFHHRSANSYHLGNA